MINSLKISFLSIISIIIIILGYSCSNNNNTPKPTAYYKITFPKKIYDRIETKNFSCEIPLYSKFFIDPNNQDWFYVTTKKYKATIYLTYKNIDKSNSLDTLIESSRKLVYDHSIKAEAITETKYINDTVNVYGILYQIKGNTATSVQFFITDSIKHFLRGSLYFDCPPNKDSLMPSVHFFEDDIVKIIETTNWK